MKAVIMAGGEGSRLRPLTCDLPKPMARLCGRPIIEYILDLLFRHGITQAALTLRYLPDRIAHHFPDSRYKDIELLFVEENQPLGTAGSVRGACCDEDDSVLVISGDAMCDFNLSAAIKHHNNSGADVTILGKRVSDPREYGLISADDNGIIRAFIEKPAFSQAISDIANTGIYILSKSALDLIPQDKSYDFAKDLFPDMLSRGMKLVCLEDEGYWCDIGDLDSYISCQRDMLEGRVDCDIHGDRQDNGTVTADTLPKGWYTIIPPVYIGRNVRIEDGAHIESGSVLDDGCFIGSSARVTASVLLQNSFIGQTAKLTGALVCAGGNIKRGAMLFEGAAVGAGATVGKQSVINAGIKIWNNKTVGGSEIVTDHIKIGGQSRGHFDDSGIPGQVGVELTPEFCARIGSAIGSISSNKRVGIAYSNHRSAQVLAQALASGIQSTGAGVMDFGESYLAQFEFSMSFCGLSAGVFVQGDNQAFLRVVGTGGLPATREMERNIEGVLARGEFTRCSWDSMGDKVEMTGMGMLYQSELFRYAPKGLSGQKARVRSRSKIAQNILADTLNRLGCEDSGELILELSSQGDKVRAFHPELGYIPHHKIFALCVDYHMQRGEDVAVPFEAPRALDEIAKQNSKKLMRYFSCPADTSDSTARALAAQQLWSRDAVMQSVLFLHAAKLCGGLDKLIKTLPEYEVSTRTLTTEINPAGLIRRMNSEKSDAITEGVLIRQPEGVVLVRPLKRGTGLKLFAEARSSETAAELCDFVENQIKSF